MSIAKLLFSDLRLAAPQGAGPPMDQNVDQDIPAARSTSLLSGQPHMLFPNHYNWFILVAALDIMMTWTVLGIGGHETNFLADAVISYRGLPGLILFKFALTLFVILMTEIIGRRKRQTGKSLAEWAVAISAIPVVVALGQLVIFTYSV